MNVIIPQHLVCCVTRLALLGVRSMVLVVCNRPFSSVVFIEFEGPEKGCLEQSALDIVSTANNMHGHRVCWMLTGN